MPEAPVLRTARKERKFKTRNIKNIYFIERRFLKRYSSDGRPFNENGERSRWNTIISSVYVGRQLGNIINFWIDNKLYHFCLTFS